MNLFPQSQTVNLAFYDQCLAMFERGHPMKKTREMVEQLNAPS
jgi:hypothetical protein